MKRLTIFIMNAVQSPVFIAFFSRADKVVLHLFSSVHDPATESFEFPMSYGFSRDLAWMHCMCFLKLEFFSWPAIQ